MSLSSRQRELLPIVSRITFANPFGKERDALDQRVAESEVEVLPRLMAKVEKLIEGLDAARLHALPQAQRTLVEHALLFDAFHRFRDAMNAHIDRRGRATFAPELLTLLVERGFSQKRAIRLVGLFFQMARAFHFIARGLVGRSSVMRRLREALWNDVFTDDITRYESLLLDRMEDFSTLLLGETGTGKGAAAAAIGRSAFVAYDPRKGAFVEDVERTYLAFNLGQFAEGLLESELFGHQKGAFTGAIDSHEGLFARARGTIFLDEIGEASPPLQVKLLRVLQERAFSPVGSHEVRRFEGRVIAATNRDLGELRRAGRFRDDLYYRLCSDVIRMPTLRERFDDDPRELGELVAHLVERTLGAPSEETASRVLAAIARDLGERPRFSGNVRELEQCVRRVLLTGRAVVDEPSRRPAPMLADVGMTADALLDRYCAELYRVHGTYEAVAAITQLDRRTVKRRITSESKTL